MQKSENVIYFHLLWNLFISLLDWALYLLGFLFMPLLLCTGKKMLINNIAALYCYNRIKTLPLYFIKKRNEMTTMIIKDNSPQAKQFIKFARLLPFATVIKTTKKSYEEEATTIFDDVFLDKQKKRAKLNISKFKVALQETKVISEDIAQNGTSRYKTLDDLLNED